MYLSSNVTRQKLIWKKFMAVVLGGPDEYSNFPAEDRIKINSRSDDFKKFCKYLEDTMNDMCVQSKIME